MEKDDAPATSTTTKELASNLPIPNWHGSIRRLLLALMFFVTALILVFVALAHANPRLLLRALITFADWSPLARSGAALATLILIGAFAGWKQFYQTFQYRQQQAMMTRAVKEGGRGSEAGINRIYALLVSRLTSDSQKPPRRRKAVPNGSTFLAPALEATDEIAIRIPQDDVQLTPPEPFIGRADERAWLRERFTTHARERDTTVLVGPTGIGKTALAAVAIDIAKREQNRFKDGVVRIPCAAKRNAVEVVRHALERIDDKHRLPAAMDLGVLQQVSEELLAGKDVLILLDGVGPNIPLGEVVRALRTRDRSADILITTNVIPSVNVASAESQRHVGPLPIVRNDDGIEVDEALELFARYAGKGSASDFGTHLAEANVIVSALSRHTYSMQLVGAYLQVQGDILPVLAEEILSLKNGQIPPEIESVLQPVWLAHTTSVNALPVEARVLLYAFGAFGGEEAGRRAVRALGDGLDLNDTDAAIHMLLRCQLFESLFVETMPPESDAHRLRVHTLLHADIARRIGAPEWEALYVRAKELISDHYAGFVERHDSSDPSRSAQRALTADAENIARALDWAIENKRHAVVAKLAHGMRRYWHDRWLNEKTLKYMPTAVDSAALLAQEARQQKDGAIEQEYLHIAADLAFTLGRVQRRVGELRAAKPLFQSDLEFRRRQRPRKYAAEAQALHQLAQLERSRGRMAQAQRYCRDGLAVVRRQDRRLWFRPAKPMEDSLAQARGLLLAQQGRIERSRGNLRQADKLFIEALVHFEQTGDLLEQGVAWGYRGRIARVLGDLPTAQVYFERSDTFARQAFDFRGQGIVATQLGRIARIRGDLEAAERAFTDGYNKALQVQDRQAVAVNLNYLGRIARSRGNGLAAEGYYKRSLEVTREIGDRLDEGMNLGYLGRIALERGFVRRAREYFKEALNVLREVQDRRGQALVLANLAFADMNAGNLLLSRWRLWRSLRLIRRVGDKRSEGTVRLYLGQLYLNTGDLHEARTQFKLALARAQSVEDCGGVTEAQQWLDKVVKSSAASGHPTRRHEN